MELDSGESLLDLNVTCPNCDYVIPPQEIRLIAPGNVRCPICRQAIALKKWIPSRFNPPL